MTALTTRHRAASAATASVLLLALAACSGQTTTPAAQSQSPSASDASAAASASAEPSETAPTEVEITDNHGTYTISVPPTAVAATDNRLFRTLADWDIALVAAPVSLIPANNPYKEDASIANMGSHNEPDLEALVAANPDLVLNGQRFSSMYEDIKSLLPDATVIELDPRDGEPFDEELRRQVTTLGDIFNRQDDAEALVAAFDEAIGRVKAAYDPSQKVIGVITSGGEINYSAPTTGRALGPVFDILGLTPGITAEGTTDHQGDDISVEAIAAANPDWILVMDRDAAVSASNDSEYTPANELLANSAALQNVTAVSEDHIVYMPQYTYTDESIQTYTEFFNSLADAMEAAK